MLLSVILNISYEEYAKWTQCKKEIDLTEDEIKVKDRTKSDLEEKHQ